MDFRLTHRWRHQYVSDGPVEFSDNFNRSDTSNGIGTDWINSHARPVSVGIYVQARIAANQLHIERGGGAGNNDPGMYLYPRKVVSGLWGKTQFAEVKCVSSVGASSVVGAAVMLTPDMQAGNNICYFVWADFATTNATLFRNAGNVVTQLGSTFTFAGNDIIRIGVAPESGQNTITVKKNGVTQITNVDTNAARPVLTGCPGIYARFVSTSPDNYKIDDFNCGMGV